MKEENKKIVSPFEFAIAKIADSKAAENMRPETREEKEIRLTENFKDFFSKTKVNQTGESQ